MGDRNFAQDYRLLGQFDGHGCRYVLRRREEAVVTVAAELPVSAADREARVIRQGWVRLGARAGSPSGRVRAVWIETAPKETLILVTNVGPEPLSAPEVGLLYRRRWPIECFFRWIKCLLDCRHWLAESEGGVTLQLYLALIASGLLPLATGRRPNKRMRELIQRYQLGWASLEELPVGLAREEAAAARRKKNK